MTDSPGFGEIRRGSQAKARQEGAGTPRPLSDIEKLLEHLKENGGRLSIVWDPDDHDALVGYEFGKEAPDSDMAGGASYAQENTIEAAVSMVAGEVGLA